MSDRKRVQYDIAVMARLRFPMPEPDDWADDAQRDAVWEERCRFEEAKDREYDDLITNVYLAADADGDEPGDPPDPLTVELSQVTSQLRALEAYRDRLIVFARTLASEPVPARSLGVCSGMSHSTIVRMVTPDAIAEVAAQAAPAAEAILGDLDPRDDPELYLRLQFAQRSAEGGNQ